MLSDGSFPARAGLFRILVAVGMLGACIASQRAVADDAKTSEPKSQKPAAAVDKSRALWTTSRVVGSPEPPSPYRLKRVFPKLKFEEPVHMLPEPGTNRLWIAEGKGRIRAFENNNETEVAETVVDLSLPELQVAPYGMLFHPDYKRNGQFFAFLEVRRKPKDKDKEAADKSAETPAADRKPYETLPPGVDGVCRVSRFSTTAEHPRKIIRESEQPIIEWKSSGHTGGGIAFGADGMLYITTGDGSSDSDTNVTGQDITDLQAGALRIDVDHPSGGRPYGIPKDNPFLEIPGARPELYAFGLRAPWRMTYDAPTNQFWIGEVGQDLWEQIHLLKRGANYGWSVREGNHPFHSERRTGPVELTGPIVEHHHTEARSITGGYVYRGAKRPELFGFYIYCDYETGKVWGFRYVDGKVLDHRELNDTTYKIPTFGINHAGELYLVAYSGEILELEPREATATAEADFPRRLSETGLFASTSGLLPAPGLIRYSVNVPVWHDGAQMERYIAIPGEGRITFTDARGWTFPDRSVLVQTLFLEMESGVPASRRPIETRIMTRQDNEWAGYSYAWNEQLTDAVLVEGNGEDRALFIKDAAAPNGARRQTWHFPSRTECMGCHSRAAAWVLGATTVQMNRDGDQGGSAENQIAWFDRVGLFDKSPAKPVAEYPRLTDPHDSGADLTARARSYLHANCAHCHVAAGGGNARLELEFDASDEKSMLFENPLHGTFGLPNGKVVARGEPARSVLVYRVSKLGRGRMPHLGSSVVDARATEVFFEWITALAPTASDATTDEGTKRLAADRQDLEALRGGKVEAAALDRLLTGVDGALLVVNDLTRNRLAKEVAAESIRRGATHADSTIRDLFERFLPEEERVPRLGAIFDPQVVLQLSGDAARGEILFFAAAGMQCKSCHAIKGKGTAVGPELTTIGKKLTREQILENLLEPSKIIDEKFKTWLVATTEGRVHTGLLVEKTAEHVVLRDAQNQLIRIPAAEVDSLNAQNISLMPTMLLRDLTAQQASDLIAYLYSLK